MYQTKMRVTTYHKSMKKEWDNLITNSKNGTFFHKRDFIEYHEHKFEDYSMMFYENEKLVGVMPMSKDGFVITSHGGLSFGGLVLDSLVTTVSVVKMFNLLFDYLRYNEYKKFIYRAIPYLYHKVQAQEDLYSLWLNDAKIVRRMPSTVIDFKYALPFRKLRTRQIKKALRERLVIKESFDYEAYWEVLIENLKDRYTPVHSFAEIVYLKGKFPKNIHLYTVNDVTDTDILAGVVLFENLFTIIRVQYIASTDEGKKVGALDLLFDFLIHKYDNLDQHRYFDFGTSIEITKKESKELNEGLIWQKEGFGGRTVVYDTYEIIL